MPLNFGGQKRSGAFDMVWPPAKMLGKTMNQTSNGGHTMSFRPTTKTHTHTKKACEVATARCVPWAKMATVIKCTLRQGIGRPERACAFFLAQAGPHGLKVQPRSSDLASHIQIRFLRGNRKGRIRIRIGRKWLGISWNTNQNPKKIARVKFESES